MKTWVEAAVMGIFAGGWAQAAWGTCGVTMFLIVTYMAWIIMVTINGKP